MKLRQVNEASRLTPELFIVQAWEPEDGLQDWFAGPFSNRQQAEKFATTARQMVEQEYEKSGGDEEHGKYGREELMNFFVEEMQAPEIFLKELQSEASNWF